MPLGEQKVDDEKLPGVTIVIPVRNEEENIRPLVSSLLAIKYPKDKMEVIIVDDASTDRTATLLEQVIPESGPIIYKRLDEPSGFRGSFKKRALSFGIQLARFTTIITTDGDCLFEPEWVRSMVHTMTSGDLEFVSGPLTYHPDHRFINLLNIELSCLVAIGAVSIQTGRPNMCNGANLCFTKTAFDHVGGYQGFDHLASGDDEFLLYKINKQFPGRVGFVKDTRAIVKTRPPASLGEFFNQRKRWSGKWKEHKSLIPGILAFFVFCFHLLFITMLLGMIFGFVSWKIFVILTLLKFLSEYLLVNSVYRFLGKRLPLKWILFMQLLYSFYVVIVGVSVHFMGYNWKSRKYQ